MYKRNSAEPVMEGVAEAKARRIVANCDEEDASVALGQAVHLSGVGDVGVIASSSEADTTCDVCEGDGTSNSVGSSVPHSCSGECADVTHQASGLHDVHGQRGQAEASQSVAKTSSKQKLKKSVRFAHGPIESSPDGHPVSEGTTMVARASPYNLFTPVKPVEALTKHSLTAMERELGDEFREENALSLVRLKRRCGIIPLKPIPRPFATSFSKSKLAISAKAQGSKKG